MAATDKGYNGWTNYETWCVNLWLGNEQGLYHDMLEMAQEHSDEYGDADTFRLADRIKSYVEEMPEVTEATDRASFVTDLLNAALSEVDWFETAEGWLSDVREDAPVKS